MREVCAGPKHLYLGANVVDSELPPACDDPKSRASEHRSATEHFRRLLDSTAIKTGQNGCRFRTLLNECAGGVVMGSNLVLFRDRCN
jgi:hypothetical protein